MAYNPSPKVRDAEVLGKKHGKDMCIVLLGDSRNGTLEVVSWGATKDLCAEARMMAHDAYDAIHMDGKEE